MGLSQELGVPMQSLGWLCVHVRIMAKGWAGANGMGRGRHWEWQT